ncbi:MAG: hypothetical protein GX303_04365, partial [Clostridiales bacterium]|nr:hypothetical protein [Clostridiales bacterium]
MARRRMIDPTIWDSIGFARLSMAGKVIFIGLISMADDEGKGCANPTYIKSTLFPYGERIREGDIRRALAEIRENLSVTFYQVKGMDYYRLDNWRRWQRIDKPQKSRIPDPCDAETSVSGGTLVTEGTSKTKGT